MIPIAGSLVSAIGNTAIGNTSGSIGTLYFSSQTIPSLMNTAYGYTVGNPVMFIAKWQAVKHAQGIHGMQNPVTKP